METQFINEQYIVTGTFQPVTDYGYGQKELEVMDAIGCAYIANCTLQYTVFAGDGMQ